ncbi:MAG: DUF2235 domain-containing protein [Alphaproteobacteria bacterium]|nr:DUF2235 domain-containing protein [Alphaproteobacteria bacterium]
MPNNVLIFSDGTGQGASMPDKQTNILRLFRATENAALGSQLAFYDPGLGASDANVEKDSSWKRWSHDLLSKATGLGISQNVKDCYAALIRLYRPGDRIYLFGFSRGAYTVRSLGGVLSLCGVPLRDAQGRSPAVDKEACAALVDEAVDKIYKHYGNDEATKSERLQRGANFRRDFGGNLADGNPAVPHFIGVFDTVRALGFPGSSGLIGWRHAFHDATLNSRVPYARHALAIDENRDVFKPELWEETPNDETSGRIKQRWFPGVHSDIGGGYAERGLSDLALEWMVDEATSIPDPIAVDRNMLALACNCAAMQHDERTGLGKAWVKGTREIRNNAVLHQDHVRDRFRAAFVPTVHGNAPYRPPSLASHVQCSEFYREQ